MFHRAEGDFLGLCSWSQNAKEAKDRIKKMRNAVQGAMQGKPAQSNKVIRE